MLDSRPVVKNFLWLLAVAVLAGVSSGRAQEVVNTNHTVVRFEISTGGLLFGSLDIELFDQEKPETVKNFLRYVYRGVYSNLVIHRLTNNFVLQAGHVTIPNPASSAAFSDYVAGANFGPINNEYSVGPELSNAFGTIAMARVGGQINSASANWFFNLANNSFLDTVDGGFTVFGRVVNTTGALTGTNLLNYFNTVPRGSATIPRTFETYSELAVSGLPAGLPRYADLFTVNARIIQGPQLPAPQHSVVRFDISTGGGFYGNLDLELFDQEKPDTVKNFLLYVYSGVYSNLVLSTLFPHFALQAGSVRVRDPNSASAFSTYLQGVNWGYITNEYGVGPELANVFGTLGMARKRGVTNSASGDFFINLTNNSSTLDTDEGGYTVFARVINSYDVRSGTNLLNYFNTFTEGNGLTTAITTDTFELLQNLPVSVNRVTPLISDLFTVRSYVTQGVTTRDTIIPVATITSPAALPAPEVYVTTNATYELSGTAGDNDGLSRVLADNQFFTRTLADGKTNWTMTVALVPGTNTILVRSLDAFGNLSTGEVRRIFYRVRMPVTLQREGLGTVTGITNGELLDLGVTYPLTATPGRGQYFLKWAGGVLDSSSRAVSFTMQSNAVVLARFTPSLFGQAPGRYEGFFTPGTNGLRKSQGQISLTFRKNGFYSGRLRPHGANYGIRGEFDESGQTRIEGQLGLFRLLLVMGLYGEGVEAITGVYSDNSFISSFNLFRQQEYGKTNPSPYAGNYTFVLTPPVATNNGATDGSGFGTVTVDAKGRIKWTATLANQVNVARDGTLLDAKSIKGKAVILKDGRWSFYYPSKTGEALGGEMQFATNGTLKGELKWFSPLFPAQTDPTNQTVKVYGSRYAPPTGRPFAWTNGVLTISGGGLANPIVTPVELQSNGAFLISSNPLNIQIVVTNATGRVGGTFNYPGSNTLTRLSGTVVQSSNSAAGFAPHLPRSAGFELKRAP